MGIQHASLLNGPVKPAFSVAQTQTTPQKKGISFGTNQSGATKRALGDSIHFGGNTFSAPSSYKINTTPPVTNPQVTAYFQTFPMYGPPPLNRAFHADRRKTLMAQLPPNTTLIVPGGSLKPRNGDVEYQFHQESNFYYLTGFDEPDSVAILSNVPDKPQFILIVPPKDEKKETWTGHRSGIEGAMLNYKADGAYENTLLDTVLKQQIGQSQNLLVLPAVANTQLNQKIYQTMLSSSPLLTRMKLLTDGLRRTVGLTVYNTQNDATEAINKMRLVKTPYEIALLQRASSISALGHINAMRNLKLTTAEMTKPHSPFPKGRNEGEIQAQVEYDFRRHGAVRQGYDTIAGGGANACVLHYNTNRQYAKPGDLELVDAGAEYGYYTADVTRTWPISGKYTPQQKAIYNLVLKAQEAGIQMTKPGVTMQQIHKTCAEIINKGLIDLGVLPKEAKPDAYQPFFMHGTSHMLGLDVHDVPSPSTSIDGQSLPDNDIKHQPLKPGNVFTVEPGIYIDPKVGKRNGVDPKWWGIGIRIEDDILVTDTGAENLSSQVPRKAEEIEALMA
jgi:Xaa-Pro aminopeptidase